MANKYKLKFSLSNGETIDAGEIVVPEGAKGDKGDKGDPYTLTSTDKAAIVQDVLAALPYYDGSVTISGGVELIDFTINGTAYQAEAGMTWYDWCNSSYNTGGWRTNGNTSSHYIFNDGYNMSSVHATDTIIANNSYTASKNVGTGGAE